MGSVQHWAGGSPLVGLVAARTAYIERLFLPGFSMPFICLLQMSQALPLTSQLFSAAGFVLANVEYWGRGLLGVEGGEQLMVLFVQQEQKESLDFQKYGVSFILGLHDTGQLCRADGGGLPAPEVRTG